MIGYQTTTPVLFLASFRLMASPERDSSDVVLPSFPTPSFCMIRRQVLGASTAFLADLFVSIPTALAEPPPPPPQSFPISASWTAVDGLHSVADDFVAFDATAYKAMKDDMSRTPLFTKALLQRIDELSAVKQENISVLDLGTGPYALFAIIAAQAGANTVYAIEANAQVAKIARETIARSRYADRITLLEGLSTDVQLPEQVDICVAEIVGSIVSEEGAVATIADAHRFMKQPLNPNNWIPNRIQTYAAPASYSLHNLFTPPAFDWSKLQGEPVRFNCRDQGLQLVADPVLVEDFEFIKANNNNHYPLKPGLVAVLVQSDFRFIIDAARLEANEIEFRRAYTANKVENAAGLATATAHSVSGICFWPRLQLNNDLFVNSRSYPEGGQQQSHWQTVLPIMADVPIGGIKGGDFITIRANFVLPQTVTTPPSYQLVGDVYIR